MIMTIFKVTYNNFPFSFIYHGEKSMGESRFSVRLSHSTRLDKRKGRKSNKYDENPLR